MSDTTTRTEEEVQEERQALFLQREPIDARLRELHDEMKAIRAARAATLTPDTEEGLRELMRIGWSNGIGDKVAGDALKAWMKGFDPKLTDAGWNSEDDAQAYIAPRVMLDYRQDVTAVTEGLKALVARLALGRSTVHVDVFEHTLSEFGSYGLSVAANGETATLWVQRYSHRTDLFEDAPLSKVLEQVARDHWYEGGPDDESDSSW